MIAVQPEAGFILVCAHSRFYRVGCEEKKNRDEDEAEQLKIQTHFHSTRFSMNNFEVKLKDSIKVEYPYAYEVHFDDGQIAIDLKFKDDSVMSFCMPYDQNGVPSFSGHVDAYSDIEDESNDEAVMSFPIFGDTILLDILKPIDPSFHVYLDLSDSTKKLIICNDLVQEKYSGLDGKTLYKDADFSLSGDKIVIVDLFDHIFLDEMIICDDSVLDYEFGGFIGTLEKASVGVGRAQMRYLDGANLASSRALKLITELKMVKSLTLNMNSVGTLSCCASNEERILLPEFSNLLVLQMDFRNYFGWNLLFEFLEKFPVLKELILHKVLNETGYSQYQVAEDDPFITLTLPQIVPSCLLHEIQNIELTVPEDNEKDNGVYKYLLENGAALTRVLVFAGAGKYRKICEKLAANKIGELCAIQFKPIQENEPEKNKRQKIR